MLPDRLLVCSDLNKNPHCAQVRHNSDYHSHTDVPFSRTLQPTAPRMKYRRRRDEVKTVVHWGQRKLLLSEIEFLTLHSLPGSLIVYAGAAPGTHIDYLADLFPNVNFELVDPAPFTVKQRLPRIRLRENSLFTDDLAREYAAQNTDILFISDIRSADPSVLSEDETEQQVAQDMKMQSTWHRLMNARNSMFKFRLPWKPGKTTYLAGAIYLPIWGPITTTESRLIVERGAEDVEYDNSGYEEQMFYFNTVTRVARYQHNITGEGIDHCYDCTAEISVLRDYLIKHKSFAADDTKLYQEIGRMSEEISSHISSHRKLSSPNPDPEQRKKVIMARQYVDGKPAYLRDEKHGHEAERRHYKRDRSSYQRDSYGSHKRDYHRDDKYNNRRRSHDDYKYNAPESERQYNDNDRYRQRQSYGSEVKIIPPDHNNKRKYDDMNNIDNDVREPDQKRFKSK